jgi:hypothetical protein
LSNWKELAADVDVERLAKIPKWVIGVAVYVASVKVPADTYGVDVVDNGSTKLADGSSLVSNSQLPLLGE